jgi:PEP-CTERM motif
VRPRCLVVFAFFASVLAFVSISPAYADVVAGKMFFAAADNIVIPANFFGGTPPATLKNFMVTYASPSTFVGCNKGIPIPFGDCGGVGNGTSFNQYQWTGGKLANGQSTRIVLRATVPAAMNKATVNVKSVLGVDDQGNQINNLQALPGFALGQTGEPILSLDLTDSMDISFSIGDFSYQVDNSVPSDDDLAFVTGGLANSVPGTISLFPNSDVPVIAGLSVLDSQFLRFQGMIFDSTGAFQGTFVYEASTLQPVPEPSTLIMLASVFVAVMIFARRPRARRTR